MENVYNSVTNPDVNAQEVYALANVQEYARKRRSLQTTISTISQVARLYRQVKPLVEGASPSEALLGLRSYVSAWDEVAELSAISAFDIEALLTSWADALEDEIVYADALGRHVCINEETTDAAQSLLELLEFPFGQPLSPGMWENEVTLLNLGGQQLSVGTAISADASLVGNSNWYTANLYVSVSMLGEDVNARIPIVVTTMGVQAEGILEPVIASSLTLDQFGGIIADAGAEQSLNASICNDLLKAVQAHGTLTAVDAVNIIAQYPQTEFSQDLRTQFQLSGDLSETGVASLIATSLQRGAGTHEEGDTYYTPLETPEFITNVISIVSDAATATVSAVLDALFLILPGIWRVVGLLGNVLWKAVSSLPDLADTEAKIDRVSGFPIYNYPLTAPTIIDTANISDRVQPYYDKFYGDGPMVYPLASLLRVSEGSTNVGAFFWTYLANAESHQLGFQCVLNANAVLNVEGVTNLLSIAADGTTMTVSFPRQNVGDELKMKLTMDHNLAYISASDQQLRTYAYIALATALFDALALRGETVVCPMRSDYDWLRPSKEYFAGSTRAVAIILNVAHIFNGTVEWNGVPDTGLVQSWTPSWAELVQYINDPGIAGLLASLGPARGAAVDVASYGFPSFEVTRPAILFPGVSRSALISAYALAAAIAATIAAGAFLGRRAVRRKALRRQIKATEKLQQARANAIANPSNKNLNSVLRANRKAVKANKRAARYGLSTVLYPMTTASSVGQVAAAATANSNTGVDSLNNDLISMVLSSITGATP